MTDQRKMGVLQNIQYTLLQGEHALHTEIKPPLMQRKHESYTNQTLGPKNDESTP